MSTANRILSVLVLLASIGAIVLAFMLFGAREEVVAGRNDMAQAIADNSNKLAQTSTEDPAKVKIAADDMSVAQGNDSVGAAIKKFDTVTKAILEQRDTLADQLVELTSILTEGESGDIKGADLANVKTNKEKFDEIKKSAEDTVQLYTKTREAYIGAVKTIKDVLKMQEPGSAALDPKNPNFEEINAALAKMKTKINDLQNHIRLDINERVPVKYQVTEGDMDGSNYNDYLTDQKNKVAAFKTDYESKLAEIENLKAEIKAKDEEIAALKDDKAKLEKGYNDLHAKLDEKYQAKNSDGGILHITVDELDKLQNAYGKLVEDFEVAKAKNANFEKKIAEMEKTINDLKKAGVSVSAAGSNVKSTDNKVLMPVQTAALAVVEAKIVHVEPESGFVVLNIGSSTKVDVKNVAGKVQKTQLVLPQNAIMTVATSLDPKNAKFVCKIQVYKVEADRAMANILPGGDVPKVGDVVFFSPRDLINSVPADEKK